MSGGVAALLLRVLCLSEREPSLVTGAFHLLLLPSNPMLLQSRRAGFRGVRGGRWHRVPR